MGDWTQTEIAPGYTIAQWEKLRSQLKPETYNDDWESIISAIEARFRKRFVEPADAIQALDKDDADVFPEGRGFAIVALDCLLLESLHGYETGRHTRSSRATATAFATVLTTKNHFAADFASKSRASSFGRSVRNGLLHDGETRDGWVIWQRGPGRKQVDELGDGRLVLYRDAFHAAVKRLLHEYFTNLRKSKGDEGRRLRTALMDRVDTLCSESRPILTK